MAGTDAATATAAGDLSKTVSRHSRLSVVDPEERAEEEAPEDVIWVEWDGPE